MGNRKTKKGLSILMLTMIVGEIVFSNPVYAKADSAKNKKAAETRIEKNINLGSYGIKNPTSIDSTAPYWQGSRVAFGKDQNLWRVLDNSGLMLSEKILETGAYHNKSESITWERSTIRSYLNGYKNESAVDYSQNNFMDTYFTEQEQQALVARNLENHDTGSISGGNDTSDKVFLISLEEVRNVKYGFGSRQTRNDELGKNSSNWWWLRSPSKSSSLNAAMVGVNGTPPDAGKNVAVSEKAGNGIRPAIMLDMSQIAFTSINGVDKGNDNVFGNADSQVRADEINKNTWDVTLKATSESLEASVDDNNMVTLQQPESFVVTHKKASILKDATQVSAMLVDQADNVLYYGKINENIESTESTVMLPSTLKNGCYTLNIFAEDINGQSVIDYATAFSSLSVSVGEVPVNDVTTLSSEMAIDQVLELSGNVLPADATYNGLEFKVKDVTTTGAVVNGNEITPSAAGKIIVTAVVSGGMLHGRDFEKDFVIEVKDPKTPIATEAPVVTESPVATEKPVVTESSVVITTPAVTEGPVVIETPVVTESPVVTELPVKSEVIQNNEVVAEETETVKQETVSTLSNAEKEKTKTEITVVSGQRNMKSARRLCLFLLFILFIVVEVRIRRKRRNKKI